MLNMEITCHLLPYVEKLASRTLDSIDTVVIHCTELPDIATARQYAENLHYDSGTGNSGHFYIDKQGHTQQWVPLEHVAHHVAGYNTRSIGIELDNRGRYPHWFHTDSQVPTDPYPKAQINALVHLLQQVQQKVPTLKYIAGHEDLDLRTMPAEDDPKVIIRRKIDPGPLFPWDDLMPHIRLINIGQQTTLSPHKVKT